MNKKSLLKDIPIAGGLFISKSAVVVTPGDIIISNECTDCADEWTHLISVELTKKAFIPPVHPERQEMQCNSFSQGDCKDSPENCVFDYSDAASVPCIKELKMVKIMCNTNKCDKLLCK